MKTIKFHNSSRLILATFLLTLFSVSCTKQSADIGLSNNTEEIASRRATKPVTLSAKPVTLPTISLKVTINDAAGNNITSDSKGDYINAIDNVQAIIDQSGTFAFNTFNSTKRGTIATRWVVYNFNNPVDPNNMYRPSPSNAMNYHFSTGGTTLGTNPFIPLQNLGVDGNPTSECIYMGNGISNTSTAWRVSFHKGYEDVSNSQTAFAVVTRTSISPAVWTITPIGSCSPKSYIASLRSEDGTLLYGYYNIPFSFTLRAQ